MLPISEAQAAKKVLLHNVRINENGTLIDQNLLNEIIPHKKKKDIYVNNVKSTETKTWILVDFYEFEDAKTFMVDFNYRFSNHVSGMHAMLLNKWEYVRQHYIFDTDIYGTDLVLNAARKQQMKCNFVVSEVLYPLCSYCKMKSAGTCTHCGAPYCSDKCQDDDWPEHRIYCTKFAPVNEARMLHEEAEMLAIPSGSEYRTNPAFVRPASMSREAEMPNIFNGNLKMRSKFLRNDYVDEDFEVLRPNVRSRDRNKRGYAETSHNYEVREVSRGKNSLWKETGPIKSPEYGPNVGHKNDARFLPITELGGDSRTNSKKDPNRSTNLREASDNYGRQPESKFKSLWYSDEGTTSRKSTKSEVMHKFEAETDRQDQAAAVRSSEYKATSRKTHNPSGVAGVSKKFESVKISENENKKSNWNIIHKYKLDNLQVLPIDPTDKVILTHKKNNYTVFITNCKSYEKVSCLDKIIEPFIKYCEENDITINNPEIGDIVLANYHGQYFRAVINSIENDQCVNVEYFDYGNEEQLKMSLIKPIFQELIEIPKLVHPAIFIDLLDDGGNYLKKYNSIFYDFDELVTHVEAYNFDIVRFTDNVYHVKYDILKAKIDEVDETIRCTRFSDMV